jgi:hypothetical protein
MVTAVQRRVRHARLRCARPEHAAHGRILLEDALRTASLPDQGRLVVFRRVDLGRLSPHSSATTWSRRLELRLQQLAAGAVCFSEPAAARADAVWFPDVWRAPIELATRLLRGRIADAWFWSAAVPGWTAGLPPTGVARLIFRLLEQRGGDAATLALARRLCREDRLFEFAALLSAAELVSWKPPVLARESDGSGDAGALGRAETPLPPAWAAMPARWRERLLSWVQSRDTGAAAQCWVIAGVLGEHQVETAGPESLRRVVAQLYVHLQAAAAARTAPDSIPSSPAAPKAQVLQPTVQTPPAGAPSEPKSEHRETVAGRPRATAAGGLLFTLNLLRQLGWSDWLRREDRALAGGLTVAWLRSLAARLALPDDDALCVWLADWGELPDFPDMAAPPDLLRECLSPARESRLRQWPLRVTLTLALQRLCWRRARLGWRPLVSRPAQMTWTDTHVDVFFTHRQADVRLRRAGLDLDPGWLPWFGRVVAFHYVETPPA